MLTKIILLEIAILIALIGLYVQIKNDTKRQRRPTQCLLTVCKGDLRVEAVLETPTKYDRSLYPDNEVTDYIKEVFGEDANFALDMAWCESRFDIGAISPSGTYHGLYQFSNSTFDNNCDGTVNNWRAQVRCTKKLLDRKEAWRWPNCP